MFLADMSAFQSENWGNPKPKVSQLINLHPNPQKKIYFFLSQKFPIFIACPNHPNTAPNHPKSPQKDTGALGSLCS
jgi:hypothetical protein